MKFKDWSKVFIELKDFEWYIVEWRCNWHKGRKPNKRQKLFLIYKGGNYLDFEYKRLSSKSIVSIKRIK